MRNRISCLSIGAVLLSLTLLSWATAQGQTNDSNLLARGQEEFSQGQFNQSLASFRNYLRKNPQDQDAWTRFGAVYYHTGQAQQALEYLSRSRPSASLRSFNTYYRALCFDALGDAERAQRLLARISKGDDQIAESALFEKMAISFAEGDAGATKVDGEEYKRRFKSGRFLASVLFMLENLSQAGKIEVAASQRILYRKNFYATHPLSLFNAPHSWAYQFGFEYEAGNRKNPADEGGRNPSALTTSPYEQARIIGKTAFTLGPYVTNTTESTFGYIYEQNWESDNERLNYSRTYPADIEYFPFRPDLMERSHILFLNSQARTSWVGAGLYAHLDFRRGGSSIFPAPERPEIRKGFNIGTLSLLVPYVEVYLAKTHKLKLSAYLEKFINSEQNDFSYKTFNFSNDYDDPYASFDLEEESRWTSIGLITRLEFFRWTYIYNDFWEGFTATGGAGSFSYETPGFTYFPALIIGTRLAYISRGFSSDTILTGSCGGGKPTEIQPTVSTCRREETVLDAFGYISYQNKAKTFALSFTYGYSDRSNERLKVYNEDKVSYFFALTQAFPSLEQGAAVFSPPRGLFQEKPAY